MWNIIGWALSAGGCLTVLYAPYSANMGYHAVSITESMAYGGLTRTVWSLGIAFLIISCHLGQGGKYERNITDYRVLFRKERSSYLCSLSTVTMSDGLLWAIIMRATSMSFDFWGSECLLIIYHLQRFTPYYQVFFVPHLVFRVSDRISSRLFMYPNCVYVSINT